MRNRASLWVAGAMSVVAASCVSDGQMGGGGGSGDGDDVVLSAHASPGAMQSDFEDGTLQGWIPRGPVTLTSSTDAAFGGTHSLKTTGRTAGFNGPSLNL